MSDTDGQGEIILYKTEDGHARVECRLADASIWLTQALMAELFQVTPQNITLHLKAIYEEGELDEGATCKDYLQVREEGGRQVSRRLRHYNLDAILAVGYPIIQVAVTKNDLYKIQGRITARVASPAP